VSKKTIERCFLATGGSYFWNVEGKPSSIVIEPRRWTSLGLKELWQYRELTYYFVWRDLKVRYRQTWVGIGWALIQPLFLVFIFTFFFSGLLRPTLSAVPYPVFAISGLVVWMIFSVGLSSASMSMISHAPVIKKVYFPRAVIPLAAVIVAWLDGIVGMVVLVGVLLAYRVEVAWLTALYVWPLAMLVTFTGTLGLGFLLASINVKYKDVRHALPFLIQVLFFLTPVVYSPAALGSAWASAALALNPMYAAIYLIRLPADAGAASLPMAATSVLSGLLLLLAGLSYFRRTEQYFADLA
jgi:lipopolysaccharide transport system permease protein